MENRGRRQRLKPLLLFLSVLVGLPLLLYAILSAYLTSPHARHTVSDLLSQYLQLNVSVGTLSFSGSGIKVGRVIVANPDGFSGGAMAVFEGIEIQPGFQLLRGERYFRTIRLSGLSLNLERNNKGTWNFSRLRDLTRKKEPAAETFIRHLVVNDGTVRVQNFEVRGLSVDLTDFSTKGSVETGLTLEGADERGNRFTMKGKGRLEKAPSLFITFSAPSADLRALARLLKPSILDLSQGRGRVELKASVKGGNLAVQGTVVADGIRVAMKETSIPLLLAVKFSGEYEGAAKQAKLTECRITVNNLLHLRGTVTVISSARRAFRSTLILAPFELKELIRQLPSETLNGFALSGRTTPLLVEIAGDPEQGVTSSAGSFGLTGTTILRKGKVLAEGVNGAIELSAAARGWKIKGRFASPANRDSLVERLNLPFVVHLSRDLQLARLETGSFSAGVSGTGVSGSAAFLPEDAEPYHLNLSVTKAPAAALSRHLPHGLLTLTDGTASMEFAATGRTFAALKTTGTVTVTEIAGNVGEKDFRLKKGTLTATGVGIGNRIAATGELVVTGGKIEAKEVSARIPFFLRDRNWGLQNGSIHLDNKKFSFLLLSFPHPAGAPVPVSVKDAAFEMSELQVAGAQGKFTVGRKVDGFSLPEGDGALTIEKMTARGKDLGPWTIHLLSGRRDRVELRGTPLSGKVDGFVDVDPRTPSEIVAYRLTASGIDGKSVGEIIGQRSSPRLVSGWVHTTIKGRRTSSGLQSTAELAGENLSFQNSIGKTILSGVKSTLKAEISGDDLMIRTASLVTARGISLSASGRVTEFMKAGRSGELTAHMLPVPLANCLDETVGILPRQIQESTAAGTVALEAKMLLKGSTFAADGILRIRDGALDMATEKIFLKGVNGRIPFSFDSSASHDTRKGSDLVFGRGNYAEWKKRMADTVPEQTLTFDRVRFGALELILPELDFSAGGGVTRLSSLKSTLYGGSLFGSGSFSFGKTPNYSLNLLLADGSLKELCNAVPAIKGYISGKVDGIISLRGGAGGIAGMKGFVDLWTRSGESEKMLVSKEFLQKLAGKNLKGIFFRQDRPYDKGEITAFLEEGYLTFTRLDISHTNFFGLRDLSVSVAPVSNRISLLQLMDTIREAALRGKAAQGEKKGEDLEIQPEFRWEE